MCLECFTVDQFDKKHGITKCPPGPEFASIWGEQHGKNQSEQQVLANMVALPSVGPHYLRMGEHVSARKTRTVR